MSTRVTEYATDRYLLTPVLEDSTGVQFLGRWRPPDIDLSGAGQHVVKETELGRLDFLAYRYYRNVYLWAVIAWVNDIENPLEDMYTGQVLTIPSPSSVQKITRAWR